MKLEAIKMIGSAAKSMVAPEAKKAVTVSIKDGASKLESAQDAMASQGKAMVKKAYVKPEMKVVEIKKRNMQAASGGTTDITDGGGSYWANEGGSTGGQNDIWGKDGW